MRRMHAHAAHASKNSIDVNVSDQLRPVALEHYQLQIAVQRLQLGGRHKAEALSLLIDNVDSSWAELEHTVSISSLNSGLVDE